MPSLLSLVFAPSTNAQHLWRQQAISSQQVFSNVEFLTHQNPYRVKALSSQEFLLTFEEPQTLCAIPDLPADQKDWSSIAARIVSAVPTSIWRDTRDRQLILYTPPILLPGPAQPSDLPLVLAPRPVTHSGDLKTHETSRRSEFAVECLNSNWAHFYLQQQSLAARGVFRRTCFKKKDVPVPAYTSSTRYFAEDQGGFYGVDVDTPDSSTTLQDAYSAPIIEEEGEMAPTIVSTQMEPVAEASQETVTTKIEPAKAAEAQEDPYVFEFPDEEEELEQLIREEAPRDLKRMAERARKASLVSIDETFEAQTNDEAHLIPPEEATHHRLDEEEDSEADTDVETDLATPEVAVHYRLSDKVHDYENESEEAAHEVQNEELHQDVVLVAAIQSTSLDVHAELENLPRRAYGVPDGAEVDPYWAPYENSSLVPESTKTSPEVCVWTTTHREDLNFYGGHVRKGWVENQGEEHDAFRRHVLSASAWSHVYVMDPTLGYKVPYGAMNRRLAEEVYEPGTSGIKRKWWYKPGAKGFKEMVDPETQTNRKTFCPRRPRLREAQSASDDADEDSYVSTSDFDQTPAEEFQHLYAGLSQDILDGGEASDWSDFGSKRFEDDDATEEEGFEEASGSNVDFAFDDEDMTSQSVREARADARSGSLNGRQSRFGLRDEDLDSVASDTELLGSPQVVKRSLSAPPSLYREAPMAGFGGDERDVEEDSFLSEQDEDSYDSSVEYTVDEPTFGDAHIVVMQRQARVFGQDDDALDSSMIQDHHEEDAEKDAASEAPQDLSFENGQENAAVGTDQKGGPEVDNMTDEGRDEDALILQDLSIATPPPAAVQHEEMEYLQDPKVQGEDLRRDSGIDSSGSSSPSSTSDSSSPVRSSVSSFAEAAMNAALQDVIERSFMNAQHQESKVSTVKTVADAPSPSTSGGTIQDTVVKGDNSRDVWLIDRASTSFGLATTAIVSAPVYTTFTPAQRTASDTRVKLIASRVPYSTLEMGVKITGKVRACGRVIRQIPTLAWGSTCGAASAAASLGNRAVSGTHAVARTVWHTLSVGPVVPEEVEQFLG